MAQMGAEIAAPLTAALERINTLTSTGRIDRRSLRALREEVESARQAGMIGQQLTRFASGRLRQSHERLQLTKVLDSVLSHRTRESRARGISVRPSLRPAEVIVDASLLFSLLNSTIDWALANAGSHIDFSVDMTQRPTHARLACCFARRPDDDTASRSAGEHAGMESLTWRLLEQTAWTMGLVVEREDDADVTTLTLEFPRSAGNEVDGIRTLEIDDGFAPSSNSQPLAGNHVLVIAARGELRTQIRDALRDMSLIIDMVNSLEEAADFCREGLPHAIIIESAQNDEPFGRFRDEISAEVPEFVFIEIVEDADTFEMSGFSGSAMARVGRDAMASSLPSALMFELSKSI
ncbi:MAG: hypothetical protein ABIQ60_02165 [Burkholderiaceae bacterium]